MDSEDINVNLAGKIKSVSCKNFVTYDECVMYPTEYLNVIIGPNGTGKSTLVAAIVLGMGGTAKLLSRAAGIQDYIKNGCTEAVVDIEIYINHQKETKKFQRRFDSGGKSEFQVNEVVVSHKNYLQAISEFNIQVDNLCQFLPQDRVQDFAKMNPQELLNNTISSVCKQDVVDKFAKLKDLRKKQLNTKKSLADDIRRLNELKHRNEELKQILDRIAAKKEFAETINICQAKKLWIEVKELKEKANEVKSNLNDAEKIVAERQSRYNKLVKDQGRIVKKSSELADLLRKQGNIISTLMQKIDEIIGNIENLESQIRRAKQEFETSKREEADRETEIYNESKALNDANEELKKAVMEVGSDADRSAKLQVIRENLSRFKVEISAQMAKRSEINKKLDEDYVAEMQVLKQRIQSMESIKELRLKSLENKFPDQYKAVMWLRKNLDKFRGRIYEPMILELNVKDAKNAKYFENSIPLRDLLAFTCENKTDMSELIEYLSIEQQLSVNIVYSAPATVCQYVPNTPISVYSDYGFFAYLIELIDGPPAILNYLCRLYQLEKILIGTDKVNDCIDSIPNNIRNYYGGDTRYNVIISKYSGEPVRSQTKIRDRKLLSGVDRAELNALKRRYADKAQAADLLRNDRSQIEAKTDELEHQRGEVMKEQRSLEMVMSKLRELKERVAKQARRVKQLKTARVDINVLQEKFKERTKCYIKEILEHQMARVNCISEYQKALEEKECATIRVNTYTLENEELTRIITETTVMLVQGKITLDNVKIAMENAAKKYHLKLVEAKNLTNGLKPSDAQFPYIKQFAELSDDIEDLKAIINDTTARLECLGENDKNVTEEYERRNAQIEALSNTITDAQNGDEGLKNEITVLYESWIPELNRVVDVLNRNFGNFMKSMDYVGEVLLYMKEEMDFDTYGIQIMVQYRNGAKIQALDRYVQSGGERAVAIAIYTLSLQQLTHVPFRCVDEINQGMDPRNERKIFDMLVEETTKIGSSQYFFVTPKLLPNLNYNDRMTVHVVFNGKFVKPKNAFEFII